MALQTKTFATGDYGWKSWSNGYVISLTLTEERTDTAANTSLVSYLFTISNTTNNRFTDSDNSWRISIGGQEIPITGFSFNLGSDYTTQTIASGQIVVSHNADGTMDMPYHVSIPNIQGWNQYGPPAMSLSGTWELTAIPRASGISCPVGTIGKPVTLSVHAADEGFSHTITYRFGNLNGTVAEQTRQREVRWTIPEAFYAQIPGARRGYGSLVCSTYSGGAFIGETRCDLIAEVDEIACRPEISAQITDENPATTALTGDSSILIRYHSDALVNASYGARNSATIADCGFTCNGKKYTEASVTVQGVESGIFDFAVTDSRGLTANLSVEKPMVPYVKLSCNLANHKPDSQGNMAVSLSGNFFDGSFGKEENSLTVQYRYKLSGAPWQDTEEEWRHIDPVITGNGYIAEAELSGLDYQRAYTFQARAMDRLETVHSIEYTARATPVFDWSENDFQFHVPVRGITADMVGARYSANSGVFLLRDAGVESGLLLVTDGGNASNYYFGLFYGYRKNQTAATFQTLCANTLKIETNILGTVAAQNAVGEVSYVLIPFASL